MNDIYLVAGFRKGSKVNSINTLNMHMYKNEKDFRAKFAWVDGPDGNNMRKGNIKLTLDDIVKEVQEKGVLRCENVDFFYVFKNII